MLEPKLFALVTSIKFEICNSILVVDLNRKISLRAFLVVKSLYLVIKDTFLNRCPVIND